MLWCAYQRHLALKTLRAALNSVLHQSTQGTQKSSQSEKYWMRAEPWPGVLQGLVLVKRNVICLIVIDA